MADRPTQKILAVSSGGGHWVQLNRFKPAFAGHEVVYATVSEAYRSDVPEEKFYVVRDATRWDKWGLAQQAFQIFRILLKEGPDVVVTTGAAPGYLALRIGKLLGARTVWVDSIANVEELSLSGKHAGKFADLWLTQWAHLERPEGPRYRGAVL